MARPLSEDKRNALLAAATQVICEQGVGAPTSLIAKGARVAEGTLFTYFATKDDLFNQLYLQLKGQVAEVMMKAYPHRAVPLERARHVWMAYVYWARKHPAQRGAMSQLGVSVRLSDETRQRAMVPLAEVAQLLRECAGTRLGRMPDFAAAIMSSLAETTIEQMALHPKQTKAYAEAGFQAFWRAVEAR